MSKQVFEDYSFSVNIKRQPSPFNNGGNQVIMTVTADEDTLAGLGSMARSIGGGWSNLANAMAVIAAQPGFMQAVTNAVATPAQADAEFDRSRRHTRPASRRGSPKPPRTNEDARRYVAMDPQSPVQKPHPAATVTPPPAVRPELPKVKPLKKK